MTDLHNALGLDDPARMAIYKRTSELVTPIAEAAIDCLNAGVTAQFTLALSDMASLKRELASRTVDALTPPTCQPIAIAEERAN